MSEQDKPQARAASDPVSRQALRAAIVDAAQRAFASPRAASEVEAAFSTARAEALRRISELPIGDTRA